MSLIGCYYFCIYLLVFKVKVSMFLQDFMNLVIKGINIDMIYLFVVRGQDVNSKLLNIKKLLI